MSQKYRNLSRKMVNILYSYCSRVKATRKWKIGKLSHLQGVHNTKNKSLMITDLILVSRCLTVAEILEKYQLVILLKKTKLLSLG